MRKWILGCMAVVLAALGLTNVLNTADAAGADTASPSLVRIGLVSTLFRDTPLPLLEPMTRPFKSLMESQAGVKGQMVLAKDGDDLRKKLSDEQVHLGVFHGFEFAWAKQKQPKLQALVLAINQHRQLKAYVVVHKDSKIDSLAALRGKSMALPRFSREHCHLYLNRRCQDCGSAPQEYFSELTRPQDAEAALDQVADGALQAAVVDRLALESYERNKPGWFGSLKIVLESEPFPATVVAYLKGGIDEATLKRCREGLVKANQSRTGKQVLGMCRISAFEEVPADYEQALSNILRVYPPAAESTPK